jgi:hypothetical protein
MIKSGKYPNIFPELDRNDVVMVSWGLFALGLDHSDSLTCSSAGRNSPFGWWLSDSRNKMPFQKEIPFQRGPGAVIVEV